MLVDDVDVVNFFVVVVVDVVWVFWKIFVYDFYCFFFVFFDVVFGNFGYYVFGEDECVFVFGKGEFCWGVNVV